MKKKIITVLALLLCSGIVGGCNKSGDSSSGREVIRYASSDNGPALERQKEIVENYNKSQDKYEVKLDAYGSAFDQKMAAAIGAKKVPDVVKMWNFPQYYKDLEPMDDFVDKLDDKDDFYETLYNYATFGKRLYGMPVGFSTRAMYVDTKKLADAGITIDENWTMEDFAKIAKETSDGDNKGFVSFYNPDCYALESFIWTYGSEGWLKEDGTSNLTDPNIEKCLAFFHDMIYKDKSVYLQDINGGTLEQDFSSGNYTFTEFGKWLVSSISEANENLAVIPLPSENGIKGQSTVHASFLSITKDSEHKDAAWDFIKYYTSKDVIEFTADMEMPVRKSVSEKLDLKSDKLYAPFYTELEQSSDHASSLLKNENWGEISIEINSTLETIFNNEQVDITSELSKLDGKIAELNKE